MDHAGAVIGPLVAWYLLQFHQAGVRSNLIQSSGAIPGVLVLILALWAYPPCPDPLGDAHARDGADGSRLPAPGLPDRSPLTAPFITLRHIALLLRSDARDPHNPALAEPGVPVAEVLLLWAALHVIRSSSSFVGGAMNDRRGSVFTMWLGWVAYALVALGFAFASSVTAAWLLFLALGVVAGFTESPERALVARLAGKKSGSGFGTYHALTGAAALVGGVGLGLVYQTIGGRTAFTVSAVGTAVLVVAWSAVALSGSRGSAAA